MPTNADIGPQFRCVMVMAPFDSSGSTRTASGIKREKGQFRGPFSWDLETGAAIAVFEGESTPMSVAFTANGGGLVAAGYEGTLHFLEIRPPLRRAEVGSVAGRLVGQGRLLLPADGATAGTDPARILASKIQRRL